MRIKVGDPGAVDALVSLNGEDQRYVLEANEEDGWIDVLCREGDRFALNDAEDGAKVERLFGVVVISIRENGRWFRSGNEVRYRHNDAPAA